MQIMTGRIYFLDSMRGILMMLGIILHSAQVYNPKQTWAIYSQYTTELSTYIIDIIHLFRMPAFFIVSGYFCLLTITKYGPNQFFNVRITRILIPLITTALTFNSIQAYILDAAGWSEFNLNNYLSEGIWVAHLWFLINLVFYFSVAFMFARFFAPQMIKFNCTISKHLKKVPLIVIILIAPLSWITIKASGKLGFPVYSDIFGIIDTFELVYYFPFFVFGIWLRANPQQLIAFSTIKFIITIPLLFLCMLIYTNIDAAQSIYMSLAYEYIRTLAVWVSASTCFNIFYHYFNKKSSTFSFLSDASYSVYLVHHLLVICLGILFINLNISAYIGLPLLIASVLLISFLTHTYVISQSKILRYLYNGK